MFPYKREFYDKDRIWTNAQTQSQTKAVLLSGLSTRNIPKGYRYQFAGKDGVTLLSDSTCYETNLLTDLFTEEARMKAYRKNKQCPYDYYQENQAQLQEKYPNRADLREAIFGTNLECSSFKITLSQAIYQFFEVRSVLDGSAGWGDRVLGAALAGVPVYTGYDPNPALRSGYAEILKFINRPGYQLIEDDFLQANLTRKYDLFFTSPPFFDYEIYCNDPKQSVSGKASLQQWLDSFLFPYLQKGFEALEKNGFFVLYMSDTPAGEYMTTIDRHMQKLGGKFLGLIATGVGDKVYTRNFPFWVWQR